MAVSEKGRSKRQRVASSVEKGGKWLLGTQKGRRIHRYNPFVYYHPWAQVQENRPAGAGTAGHVRTHMSVTRTERTVRTSHLLQGLDCTVMNFQL